MADTVMHMISTSRPRRAWRGIAARLMLAVGLSTFAPQAGGQTLTVGPLLKNTHSHNDYEQERPLAEALEQGFRSVEADIHWVDNRLLVAHDLVDAQPEKTLDRMYLEPLWRIFQAKGKIHQGETDLILLIDFKSNAETTYAALQSDLSRYEAMLTRLREGKVIQGAVTVVISGNRPRALMERQANRLCFLDGRPEDLGRSIPNSLIPLVSSNWKSHFKWDGSGAMPENERDLLADIVQMAGKEGKLLRFWATPDVEAAWGELGRAGVGLINTDHLAEMRKFLSENR